jgi:hypothetical protein
MGDRRQVEVTHRRLLRTLADVVEPGGSCVVVTTRTRQVYGLAAQHGFEARHRRLHLGSLEAGAFLLSAR